MHVRTDSVRNPVHQTDRDSRKSLQDLQGRAAYEEVVVQVDGTGVVDVGVVVEAKVLVQEVDVGQHLVGTVGTPQEVQEAEVHLSKVVASRVHWMMEE